MNDLEIGICIKNMDKEVLFQNDLCIKSCGMMVGKICTHPCMSEYSPISGMSLYKNTIIDNMSFDAVVINDGEKLTTLLHLNKKSEEEKQKEKEKLLAFGLSKSETAIFLLVLDGKKNSQIIKELFISMSTLKTHLNNIYKKLPENYQQYKNRR